MSNSRIKMLILAALFAALTAVCSQIIIPLPFTLVPINLATLAVFLAGALLGKKWGTVSMAVYVALGMIGLPVFASMQGGIGVLVGPTGGYIVGYIVAAIIIGIMVDHSKKKLWAYPVAMLAGLASCYLIGTTWYTISMQTNFIVALAACVIPFLIGDALKIIVASLLSVKLRKILDRKNI